MLPELALDPFHKIIAGKGVQLHALVEEEVDLVLRGAVHLEVQAGLAR